MPLPVVVPRILSGEVCLVSCVFNRYRISAPDTLLLHSHSVQVTLVSVSRPNGLAQLFTGIVHAAVDTVTLTLGRLVLLSAEQLPCTVDRPVTEVSETGHTQGWRRRREHVLAECADAVEVFGFGLHMLLAGNCRCGLLRGRLGRCAGEHVSRRGEETSCGRSRSSLTAEKPAEREH